MKSIIDDSTLSLSDVHRSVHLPANAGFFKRILAFAGPAYLVSVGYMDPGNWATDIEGGARFGYSLLWVLIMSNAMAVLLQTLSARMGIATGRDLAQACRDNYPKPVARALWVLCEIAIAACDLAEVLGTAIGLNLLFHLPLLYGVIITGFDTMLFLVIQQLGIRKMEAFILALVTVIGVCFGIEVFLSKPVWGDVVTGAVPHLSKESLYIAIGIIGATVMPHNLYLHSALVQTRNFDQDEAGKKAACKYNLIDTLVALNAALLVNAAILIVAGAVFYTNGVVVTEIQQAHSLLAPLLGTTLAGTLFAVALIAAGQSSTLTGTLAGQIVMEGFLRFRLRPVIRRIITRLIAIVPAVIVISVQGEKGTYPLLILSQVILSLQLPFAVVPLIGITSDKRRMGSFANPPWVIGLAWIVATIIIGLNAKLVLDAVGGWIEDAGPNAIWIWLTAVPVAVACALLLLYMILPQSIRKRRSTATIAAAAPLDLTPMIYKKIGVALDYSSMDSVVLAHARTLASQHHATVYLFHIVEGISGQLFGGDANDSEAREDKYILEGYATQLKDAGATVHLALGFGRVPVELVRLAQDSGVDLLVMGGHRHRGLKDLLLGASISKVRHALSIPVLVIQK